MKRWILFAGLMLTLAGSALAQSQQVQNMGTFYRNPQSGQITDAFGNAYTSDAYRDRDFKVWTTMVNDTVSAITSDSTVTGPFYTAQVARMWLRIQVTWPNASDGTGVIQKGCRFAVQIRGHLTAATDSLNTNPWYVYADTLHEASFPGGPHATLATALGDTLGYRMAASGGAIGVGQNTTLLPSEILFTAYRPPLGTGAQGSNLYGEPANFWIPLADSRGVYFWAPYTSVRVRVISNLGGTTAAAQPKFVVDLVGTAK